MLSKYFTYGIILQTAFYSVVLASESEAQRLNIKEVEVEVKSQYTSLNAFFKDIEDQTDFKFAYSDQDIRKKKIKGDLKSGKRKIYDVLIELSKTNSLKFKQINNSISVDANIIRENKSEELVEISQEISITGRVTSVEDPNGLPGVTILLKGTTRGTITDINGNYAIMVPSRESVLVFSSIGFVTEEVSVNEMTVIDMTMVPDITSLDEVVVIGYGTVKKGDLTGSVSQISSGQFERVPATNALEALRGRVSGLFITPSSGQPGASNNVVIRGTQSINGTNSPIYVVDGTITESIDNINSQDIETVTVLKDASAVAIYGSRAANGVIQVTTKRGTKSRTPAISFNTGQSIQQQGNMQVGYVNADQWLELYTEAYENAGQAVPWTDADLEVYDGVDVDWPNAVIRTGALQTYNLSVSGGSENSNYLVSLGYLKNKGIIEGQDFSRINVRLNSDHRINKVISFGNSLNIFSNKQNDNTDIDGRNVYAAAYRFTPLNRNYEEDGDFGIIRNTLFEGRSASPLWMLSNTELTNKTKGLIGNLYLTLDIIEGLKFTTRGSLEWTGGDRSSFIGAMSPHYGMEGSNVNLVEKENSQTTHWISDFLLDYNKVFNGNHSVSALLGYSLEEQTYENLMGKRGGTPNNNIRYLNAGDPLTAINANGFFDWSFRSMFGRVSYSFKEKYFLSGVVRRDGTSRLASGNKFGTFPSISAAWRISDEEFMKDINLLNDLKLRASWGKVGNILSISTYGTTSTLSQWNYVLNQQPVVGYTLADAVNTDLTWESTTKKNLGLDLYLYDSKVFLIGDFYIEDTHDLLFNQPIPYSTGLAGTPFVNAGHVRNTGLDLELGYRKESGKWSYNVSANISHVKNEVIDLEGKDLRTNGIVEGHPLFTAFGYKSNGIIRTEEDLNNSPQFAGKEVGDIWLLDIDGYDENGNLTGAPDGIVDAADRTLIGKIYPDISYGFYGSVGYKSFTLQLQLQGVSGIDRDMRGGRATDAFAGEPNVEADYILDRYHSTKNPNGEIPRVTIADRGQNNMLSDFWLRDASYLSIRNVNLNYDFQDAIANKIGMRQLSVYGGVQNLYTFTSFYGTGIDVNFNPGLDDNQTIRNTNDERNNNLTSIPIPRIWTLGLKATF